MSDRDERFIVHYTVMDPLPQSTYGTSTPSGWAIARADANSKIEQGRRVYITKRDSNGEIIDTIREWD